MADDKKEPDKSNKDHTYEDSAKLNKGKTRDLDEKDVLERLEDILRQLQDSLNRLKK